MSKYIKSTVEGLKEVIDNREPLGLFWAKDNKVNKYVAVDNSTGEAWTEEFDEWEECKKYLEES